MPYFEYDSHTPRSTRMILDSSSTEYCF